MNISEEDRNVCVGGYYSGSKVTKLEETVTDVGERIRTRKLITVESGIIYKLDLFVDKETEVFCQPETLQLKGIGTKKKQPSIKDPNRNASKDSILSMGTVKTSNIRDTDPLSPTSGSYTSEPKSPDSTSLSPPDAPPLPAVIRQVPKEFENGKSFGITVFPKSDLTTLQKEEAEEEEQVDIDNTEKNHQEDRGVSSAVGEWRYPKGKETKDDHFLPQEVDLYFGNDEPLFPNAGPRSIDSYERDDDESSMSSFGLWGLDAGDDQPHQSWTRSSRNICFPPGMEPSDDVDILGRWVYSPENKQNFGPSGVGILKKNWPPPTTKSAWVFTKKDTYDGDFDPLVPAQGIWKAKDISFEDMNWQPQQVDLYNSEEDNDDESQSTFDDAVPNGTWGIKKGAKPQPGTSTYPPNQVWFYPPGEEPEPECIVKGKWCLSKKNHRGGRNVGKLNTTWPPPEIGFGYNSGMDRSLSSCGSASIPLCFENGKVPIKVFPRSSFPGGSSTSSDSTAPKKVKKKVRFDLIGQWAYPDGEEEDDNHWMPQTVDLYLGENEPPYPASEESSMSSFGLWGTRRSGSTFNSNQSMSSGSVSLSLSLDWTPEGSLVYPPGVEPDEDDDVEIHGKWAYPGIGHETVKIEWPPPMAQSAWVFPESNVPGVDNSESRGIWKFNTPKSKKGGTKKGDDNDDSRSQWQAKKVQLYSEDEKMEEQQKNDSDNPNTTKVWGKWGIRRGAEPDDKWNWKPKDLWFYPPGEDPADECLIQGSWAALKSTWPPPTRKIGRSLRQVGKLQIPSIEDQLASPKSGGSRSKKSVGKLKMPSTFGEAASPDQRRKVAKLKIPGKFL